MQAKYIVGIGVGILIGGLGVFLFTPAHHHDMTTSVTTTADTLTIKIPASHPMTPTMDGPENPDAPNSHWFYSDVITLDADTTITGFSIAMEGGDMSVLHHVSVNVLGRVPTICPRHFLLNGGAHELYSASRHTLEPVVLPAPYGIQLRAGEQLMIEFMAHPQADPHGAHHAHEDLEPTLVVTLATDSSRTIPVDFMRLRLDDTPCAAPLPHQAFVVPTSTAATTYTKTADENKNSSSYKFTADTTIILGGANFWPEKGGQNVQVLIDQEPIATYTAEPDSNASKWNIPLSGDRMKIKAGSTIEIASTYKNPFTVPVLDASGMYGFYYTLPLTN
jgi:hypothetical protein